MRLNWNNIQHKAVTEFVVLLLKTEITPMQTDYYVLLLAHSSLGLFCPKGVAYYISLRGQQKGFFFLSMTSNAIALNTLPYTLWLVMG